MDDKAVIREKKIKTATRKPSFVNTRFYPEIHEV